MPNPWTAAVLPLALAIGPATTAADDGPLKVFVGTYTANTSSRGIYRFDFDPATGAVSEPVLAAETTNPSFLAIDPTRRFLYAVGEVASTGGAPGGGVSAFAIDGRSGELTFLNSQSSGGAGPCHLAVDRAGKNVLVANYGGGSVAVLPVGHEGRLEPRSAFIQHEGSSVHPARQKEPHAHSVNLDPSGRFAVVADLGIDQLRVDRFEPGSGRLTPNDPPAAQLAPGSGPRHFAFHPGGRFAYVINELNSTVTAWAYDPDRGLLTEIQTITTLPEGFGGTNYPAEVQVHPSGRFLFGSNRGHNSIVTYAIDPDSGRLELVDHEQQGIKNPRHFGIAPDGRFLLVASQDLGKVVVFRLDPAKGTLEPTGGSVPIARPVCVRFWSARD